MNRFEKALAYTKSDSVKGSQAAITQETIIDFLIKLTLPLLIFESMINYKR